MSFSIEIEPLVYEDLSAVCTWYEDKIENLGDRFAEQFFSAVSSLDLYPAANPLFQPLASFGVRHRLVGVFPYSIYFRILGEKVVVHLLYHGARSPRALRRALTRRLP